MENNRKVQYDEDVELLRRKVEVAYCLFCEGCPHSAHEFSATSGKEAAMKLHEQGWRLGNNGGILCKKCAKHCR